MSESKEIPVAPCPCCGNTEVDSTINGLIWDHVVCSPASFGCGLRISREDCQRDPRESWNERAALPVAMRTIPIELPEQIPTELPEAIVSTWCFSFMNDARKVYGDEWSRLTEAQQDAFMESRALAMVLQLEDPRFDSIRSLVSQVLANLRENRYIV